MRPALVFAALVAVAIAVKLTATTIRTAPQVRIVRTQ